MLLRESVWAAVHVYSSASCAAMRISQEDSIGQAQSKTEVVLAFGLSGDWVTIRNSACIPLADAM